MGFSVNEIKTNYTKQLSDYTEQLTYDQIPAEVIERAKMIVLQTFGVSLAAKGTESYRRAVTYSKLANGGEGGETTVWGDGCKLSMENAVMANGSLADVLDWEDCSWTGHPSASIVPVAWGVAEARHKSGKDLLTAVVAAYEVYQRIAMAVQPPHVWNPFWGWGLTSWQIFGSTVPAAKLMGLNSKQINQALGISCQISAIPSVIAHATMSDVYHYEHGIRSKDGVQAARMAEIGVDNCMEGFDDQYAYGFHMTSAQRPEWYTKDLGKKYLTMETLMKHWPTNMWVQTPVEITHDLAAKYDIKPEEVDEIVIDPPVPGRMAYYPEGYSATTQAQFSIPFCVATMLYDRIPGAHWFSRERMNDRRILDLAAKVRGGDSEPNMLWDNFEKFRAGSYPMVKVSIKMKNGNIYEESMDRHPGHPYNMMTRKEFVDRFRVQAGAALGEEKTERAINIICNLEKYDDIADLSDILY